MRHTMWDTIKKIISATPIIVFVLLFMKGGLNWLGDIAVIILIAFLAVLLDYLLKARGSKSPRSKKHIRLSEDNYITRELPLNYRYVLSFLFPFGAVILIFILSGVVGENLSIGTVLQSLFWILATILVAATSIIFLSSRVSESLPELNNVLKGLAKTEGFEYIKINRHPWRNPGLSDIIKGVYRDLPVSVIGVSMAPKIRGFVIEISKTTNQKPLLIRYNPNPNTSLSLFHKGVPPLMSKIRLPIDPPAQKMDLEDTKLDRHYTIFVEGGKKLQDISIPSSFEKISKLKGNLYLNESGLYFEFITKSSSPADIKEKIDLLIDIISKSNRGSSQ